jgi:diguanylate cyclase (GGDEF)-like protein
MNFRLPKSRHVQVAAIFLSVCGIALVDWVTGSEFRVYPLYFVPIALAAHAIGRNASIAISLLCTGVWLATKLVDGTQFSSTAIWIWNSACQAIAFLIVAILVSQTKESLERESESARVDSLTGLLNSRAFYERAPALVGLCRRENRPIAMAYIDLDRFKAVNDTLGHQRGDDTLRIVAGVLKANLRNTDLLARFGGDEFGILLPYAYPGLAEATLERIRQSIESRMRAEECDVTASIGAASYSHAPDSLEEMIQAADLLMYSVKETGRNCVRVNVIDGRPNEASRNQRPGSSVDRAAPS